MIEVELERLFESLAGEIGGVALEAQADVIVGLAGEFERSVNVGVLIAEGAVVGCFLVGRFGGGEEAGEEALASWLHVIPRFFGELEVQCVQGGRRKEGVSSLG